MSSSIDEQFVEYIVKSLVNNPDDVILKRTIDEKGVLLELTVNPDDLGRVIGKRGATAQSIRTLLRALGTKNEARYNLKIVDNGVPREHSAPQDDASSAPTQDEPVASSEDTQDQDEQPLAVADDTNYNDTSSDDDGEETHADKTRRELADLDDLDI